MPGPPRIGQGLSLRDQLAEDAPSPEVLGTVKDTITDPAPQGASAAWQHEGQQVDFVEPPPPWELEDKKYLASDAKRYVDVPANWVIRWANPKLVEQHGYNHWTPVSASDPRVKVKVASMTAPDGTIRRGGMTGDLLVWMYRTWVESRREQYRLATARLTQSAVDRMNAMKEDFDRGKYGPNVHLDAARHPTHTQAEGRSMRQLDPA